MGGDEGNALMRAFGGDGAFLLTKSRRTFSLHLYRFSHLTGPELLASARTLFPMMLVHAEAGMSPWLTRNRRNRSLVSHLPGDCRPPGLAPHAPDSKQPAALSVRMRPRRSRRARIFEDSCNPPRGFGAQGRLAATLPEPSCAIGKRGKMLPPQSPPARTQGRSPPRNAFRAGGHLKQAGESGPRRSSIHK